MTAKQKNKNSIIDKNSHSNQDDVARKEDQGSEARGSGSWAKVLAVLCYIVLVAAAGSVALYFQRVMDEMGQISRRTEASVHKNAELALRMDSVLQQVCNPKIWTVCAVVTYPLLMQFTLCFTDNNDVLR